MPPAAPVQIKTMLIPCRGPGVQIAASSGATVDHWRFKKSLTSGGPYVLIWMSPFCVYEDYDVRRGETHYYVVTIVNQTGESPNSAEVSITIA